MLSATNKLFSYLVYVWRKYDVTVTFMTLMSCDSVCCEFSKAWSSRRLRSWPMANTLACYACVPVFLPMVDIVNIPCDCQFVFSVLDEPYVSYHAWCSG